MFENLKGTFDRSVATVSVKSEVLVETSRTKTAIAAAQKKLDGQTAALGVKIYTFWKNGQNDMALFQEDLRAIQATEKEINALNDRLEQIKQEESRILGTPQESAVVSTTTNEGASFCSNCGKALAAGSRFCGECGTPVMGAK